MRTLCRSLYFEHSSIWEDFLCFVAVDDVCVSSLVDALKREQLKIFLHLNMMRGQRYDGVAVMSGVFNGLQVLIWNNLPMTLYTHYSSHSLNLCFNDASAVQDIGRAITTISKVSTFFQVSSKRKALLKKHLEPSTKPFG